MPDEVQRSAAFIERLLVDPGRRADFRRDPDGVLAAHGLDALSAHQRALLTLELRESRSSRAGATFAATVDGLQATEAAAHAAPGWAHAVADEISRLLHRSRATPTRAREAPAREPLITADLPPLAHPPEPPGQTPEPPGQTPEPPGQTLKPPAQAPPVDSASADPRRGTVSPETSHGHHFAQPAAARAHSDAAQVHADSALLAAHRDPLAYPGDDASPRALAAWMGAHATRAGLPPELPVMAALTESGLRNLSYGDRDSVGFFQMRTGIWDRGVYAGYPHDPSRQLRWFIDQALAVRAAHAADPGFGRQPASWGEWVADVEQPAAEYRGRYQGQLHAAQDLLAGADLHVTPTSAASPGQAALRVAERYLGTRYDWGGSSPAAGFDCSGLVQFAYAQVGIHLPRVAAEQFDVGAAVARADLAPGDAVFFADSSGIHHVGLYIGDGRFINAPRTGEGVRIDSLSEPYFAAQYAGARRYGGVNTAMRAYARTLPALGG